MTTSTRYVLGIAGLSLVLLSIGQIAAAARGLEIAALPSATLPVTIVAPSGAAPGSRPVVLIGHGFAGSGLLMRGFAFTLAHAGYVAVLWDFDGHGANPRPWRAEPLIGNAEAALAQAEARSLVAPGRVAILGHSMGSGVALEFGQAHPETAATIAISPVGQPVTPSLPRNLLLMAGSLEQRFLHNAEQRLAEAGGPGGDPALGTAHKNGSAHRNGSARKLIVVPGVEHMSILFAPAAHAAVVEWLDAAFGPQPGAETYTDQRMLWYGIGLLGTLLLAAALAPRGTAPLQPSLPRHSLYRPLAALAGGALGATLLLWLANLAGLQLRALFGLLIGGYLAIWFGMAGALSLLLLGKRPTLPSRRALLGGGMAFAALWLGVGLLGQFVWYPWLLIGQRLRLWPLSVLLVLPWFLAVAQVPHRETLAGQLGRWLIQSVVLAGALLLALRLSPELGFLALILPAFPAILGLHALAAAPHRGLWAFASSGALFTSWALLAIFPLQSS